MGLDCSSLKEQWSKERDPETMSVRVYAYELKDKQIRESYYDPENTLVKVQLN